MDQLAQLIGKNLRLVLSESIRFLCLFVVFSVEAVFIMERKEFIFHVFFASFFVAVLILNSYLSKAQPVYMVDFSCLKPPNFCRVPFSTFMEHVKMLDFLDGNSIDFMSKILTSSGQGQETYLPPALHCIPPKSSQYDAVKEVHMVLFPVFEDLLAKTNLSPFDVDILIVNCSGFCPNPSLSSILVNKYSMREDIKTFNLAGMGCSASALAVDLAQNLLKTRKNSNAVILSTEILSTGWYPGKEQPMLVLNCLFRMGSAAILVTNKKTAYKTSKYKLVKTVRTQRAFDDKGYYSAFREEDSQGLTGVILRRELLQVAGETLRSNITILGSSMLPMSEKIRYGVSILWKKFMDKSKEVHVPNFKAVIQHFCLPASGRPVIREIGKGLKLGERDMEPALMTLHRFGNQSSSSLWYELAYMEAKDRIKKGDKLWQLGMGTGPKCTSLVWECIGPIVGDAIKGPWADTIDSYPILTVDNVKPSPKLK